jgi:hypothetical protein
MATALSSKSIWLHLGHLHAVQKYQTFAFCPLISVKHLVLRFIPAGFVRKKTKNARSNGTQWTKMSSSSFFNGI